MTPRDVLPFPSGRRQLPVVTLPGLALLLAAAACGGGGAEAPERDSLTVLSWGGAYEQAVRKSLIEPFAEARNVDVRVASYNGGLREIRAQVASGQIEWDVVDLEIFDARRRCDDGLLERFPAELLAPALEGTPAVEDFIEGALNECGLGTVLYSVVQAHSVEAFSGEAPAAAGDFFDLERFPGRRGMRRTPQGNLEFALLADGVPKDEVYAVLATPEGVERAFRRLEGIRDSIVWWDAPSEPVRLLASGEVSMSTAFNGRIFHAQFVDGLPLAIVWDRHILESAQWAIVAGTPNLELALDFVRFAGAPESMARLAARMAYGPVRASAMRFITTHPDLGIDLEPHLPTSATHAEGALRSDGLWWAENLDVLNERFLRWLDGS